MAVGSCILPPDKVMGLVSSIVRCRIHAEEVYQGTGRGDIKQENRTEGPTEAVQIPAPT